MPDPGMHSVGTVMPSPHEIGVMPIRDDSVSQPVQIGALATALANAPPDQLMEMDQTEVLHLLEFTDALKAMVAETMEVLRSSQHLQQSNVSPEQQLVNLSLKGLG